MGVNACIRITGGSSGGGGGCGGCNPPLNFPKNSGHLRGHCDRFTCLAVVIDVVAASSNNVCLCAFAIE